MQELKQQHKHHKLFLVLGGCIVVYLLLRTYFIDITDDEAWSFYNVKHFWYVEALCTGNTHWFNFAAIKAALLFDLEATWQIRWFSVICAIVFIIVGYNWVKSINKLELKWFAFTCIFFNPYVLEYLTLARGYSQALCFQSLSILLFIQSITKADKKWVSFCALMFAGFSAIASFNFLYFFVAFAGVYFYHFYFKRGFSFFKSIRFYIDLFYVIAIILLVLRALWFIKECSNDIADFGGNDFVLSLFYSYLDTLVYGNFIMPVVLKTGLAYALFSFIVCAVLFGIVKYKSHRNHLYTHVSIMLLAMFIMLVISKQCFNVLYPTQRTSFLFYLLFAIVIVGFLNVVFIGNYLKKMVIYAISIFFTINLMMSMTINRSYDHSQCEDGEQYFSYLKKLSAKKVGIPIELYCVFKNYYQTTNYNLEAESINTVKCAHQWTNQTPLHEFDYILVLPPYNLDYYKNSKVSFQAVRLFPETKALILKIK